MDRPEPAAPGIEFVEVDHIAPPGVPVAATPHSRFNIPPHLRLEGSGVSRCGTPATQDQLTDKIGEVRCRTCLG